MAITEALILTSIKTISESLNDNQIVKDARTSILEGLTNSEFSKEERDDRYSTFVQQLSLGLVGQAVDLARTIPILILEEKRLKAEADKAEAIKQTELDILNIQKEKEDTLTLINIATLKKQWGYDALNGVISDSADGLVDKQIEIAGEEKNNLTKELLTKIASLEKNLGYTIDVNGDLVKNSDGLIDKNIEIASETKNNLTKDILTKIASLGKNLGFDIDGNGDLVDNKGGLIDLQIKGFDNDVFYKIANIISQETQMLAQNDLTVQPWQIDIQKMAIEKMSGAKINISKDGTGATTVTWDNNATDPDGID